MHLTIGADAALVGRLLAMIDRPTAGVIYDPANLYLARRPYRLSADPHLAALAGRVFHVQLKDGDLTRQTPARLAAEPTLRFGGDFDLLLGEGRVDLRGALDDLRRAGYGGWYSVETHASPRPGPGQRGDRGRRDRDVARPAGLRPARRDPPLPGRSLLGV